MEWAKLGRRLGFGLVWAGLIACLVVGCRPVGDASQAALGERTVRIVTTTSIIADLMREVGGERVEVQGLMGPGVDPHLYTASEGDVTRMANADLIVYNGLDLEGKMTDVLAEIAERGRPTVALAEESVPDSLLLESPDYAGNYDPHIWLDVQLWKRAARHAAATLAAMDTAHAAVYEANAAAYADSLDRLDAYVRAQAERIPARQRALITSHDAFRYFGRAYGFEVRGLQGISTATEAGTADVQRLAAFVAERRIPAMFVETSVPRRGIEAVQAAVRARGFDVKIGGTLYGDALGGPSTPAATYLGMVRTNIDTIVSGLLPEEVAHEDARERGSMGARERTSRGVEETERRSEAASIPRLSVSSIPKLSDSSTRLHSLATFVSLNP